MWSWFVSFIYWIPGPPSFILPMTDGESFSVLYNFLPLWRSFFRELASKSMDGVSSDYMRHQPRGNRLVVLNCNRLNGWMYFISVIFSVFGGFVMILLTEIDKLWVKVVLFSDVPDLVTSARNSELSSASRTIFSSNQSLLNWCFTTGFLYIFITLHIVFVIIHRIGVGSLEGL